MLLPESGPRFLETRLPNAHRFGQVGDQELIFVGGPLESAVGSPIAADDERGAGRVTRGGTVRFVHISCRGDTLPDYLGGRASHILSPRTLRTLPDIELDAVSFTQIVESLAIHRAFVKKILLPGIVLDEPKSLIDS